MIQELLVGFLAAIVGSAVLAFLMAWPWRKFQLRGWQLEDPEPPSAAWIHGVCVVGQMALSWLVLRYGFDVFGAGAIGVTTTTLSGAIAGGGVGSYLGRWNADRASQI